MNLKQSRLLKVAGICGILSAIVFFICIAASVYHASWFSWTENWLSELGGSFGENPIWAARGMASVVFNSGLIIAGTIGILFSIAIRKSRIFTTGSGRIGTSLLFVNMSALCGVGIFPVTLGKIHVWSSLAFFGLIPLFLFVVGFEMRNLFGKKWWWMINLLSGISLCSVSIFLFMPHLSNYSKAIAEMVMLCSIFVFCTALSIKLLKVSFGYKEINAGVTFSPP